MDNVTARVARQYTAYAYPEAFEDLDVRVANGFADLGDPKLFGFMFWPEGRPDTPLRILVAGCGTVQASVLAYSNPQASVVGVDLSDVSLGHQRFLREKFGLTNLELFQGDILDIGRIGGQFDLIVSTGVLHHLADPDAGLKALASVLAPDGAMLVMVYGAVGRIGVYLLQDAFRRIGLQQTPEDIALIRTVLDATHRHHPVQAYRVKSDDLAYDSGIVDTFLHPQDRAYTVPQILAWAEGAGLGLQNWMENALYYPDAFVSPALQARITALPEREQWAAVENLLAVLKRHSFTLRHPGKVHQVAFEGGDWPQYRPRRFPDAELGRGTDGGCRILRDGVEFGVTEAEAVLFELLDGTRTIEQLMATPRFVTFPEDQRLAFAREHFSRMWRFGLVMFQR